MSEDGHHVIPDTSRNSDIESSSKKTKLTAEEEGEIKKLEWRHHIEIGDLLTKGQWNKKHQDKIASCIPSDLQGKTVLDIGFNDGYFSFLSEERGAEKVTGVEINYRETAKLAHRLKQSRVEF